MNANVEDARVRSERLRWASRRALLELDLVLARFWQRQPEILDEETAKGLERLLALEDFDLWQILSGRREAEPALQEAVALVLGATHDSPSHSMRTQS